MRIEFIGTGNAHGTPTPGCGCRVCREAQINLERRRRAPCLAVSTSDNSATLVIDAGDPAINSWLERPQNIGVLLSHFHPGHYHALLAHRRSNGKTRLLCPPDRPGIETITKRTKTFEIEELSPYRQIDIAPFSITPVLLNHSVITYGYCIEADGHRLAYLCDTCGLPPQTTQHLQDWHPGTLIIDCNQHPKSPKPTHNTPNDALGIHRSTGARRSLLTHVGCSVDAWLHHRPKSFPKSVAVARDGMVVEIDSPASRSKSKNAYV